MAFFRNHPTKCSLRCSPGSSSNLFPISLFNCLPVQNTPDCLEVVCLNILILLSTYIPSSFAPEDNTHVPTHQYQGERFRQSLDLDSILSFNISPILTGVVTICNSPSFLTSHPHPLPWIPARAPLKVVWSLSNEPYLESIAFARGPEGSS